MCNECYIARMSGRPPFPPPTHSPFTSPTYSPFGNTTGTPYPFHPFTSYGTHPGQMMPAQGYPVYGRPQMPPPPVWPYQHAHGNYYQKGGGTYNPQIQGVDDISNGGDFNMGPKMGDNNKFVMD